MKRIRIGNWESGIWNRGRILIASAFLFFVFIPAEIFATGTATISPSVAGAGTTGSTFVINYADAYGVNWTSSGTSMGYLTVQIPSGWPTPTTGGTAAGNVQAFIVSSGNPTTVPANDVSINGNTITITDNGLDISWYDTVEIVYGAGGGNYGVTVPSATGTYTFNVTEAPSGSNNTALTASPIVTVETLSLQKTGSEPAVAAGDTYTYTINYGNNSQTTASNVYILDTIPQELDFEASSPSPAGMTNIAGSLFTYWYLTSVASENSGGSITITTLVNSAAITMASSITNTAYATSDDMQAAGVTLQSNACIANVKGVVLTARIDGYPNPALVGQVITMDLLVSNAGYEVNAANVAPGTMGDANSSLVTINSGPTPSYVSSLAPGFQTIFTWVFTTNAIGTVVFTDNASASEVDANGTYTRTSNTYAFTFVIANPTQTSTQTRTWTPTSTRTNTPTWTPTDTATNFPTSTYTQTVTLTSMPTLTNTLTATLTITPTWTLTDTPTNLPTLTDTLTSTQTITQTQTMSSTPTNTNTVNPAGSGPTATVTSSLNTAETSTATPITVVTATPTPNLTMTLSKNYVNPNKGENLLINVKAVAGVRVKIRVYNLTGEAIRTNLDFTAPADGWNQVQWDLKNDDGKVVGEGLYFIYIDAGTGKKLMKVYIIK